MKAMELIRFALKMTDNATATFVEELRSAPLTQPSPNCGNHPHWTMGHLAFIEGAVRQVLLGEANPVQKWEPLFAMGSKPKADASGYPPFDEVLRTYRDLRAHNLKLLEELGEEGLDRKPVMVPPGFESSMQTFGQTLLLIGLHNMQHIGQISIARRAAGIPVKM